MPRSSVSVTRAMASDWCGISSRPSRPAIFVAGPSMFLRLGVAGVA